MPRLNQILAIEKGLKTTVNKAVTDAYHLIQKAALMTGMSRTYRPIDDESTEILPSEYQKVQVNAMDVFAEALRIQGRLIDVTAVKDFANRNAVADVVLDGVTLIGSVPVTHLLFLEKQLTDMQTFINKLPVLDPSETWTYDVDQNVYRTEPVETQRSKKVPRAQVLYPATEKHPAQVQAYTEDILVGYWTKTNFSGAVPQSVVRTLNARVERLLQAVKMAREEANSVEVADVHTAKPFIDYLLDGMRHNNLSRTN